MKKFFSTKNIVKIYFFFLIFAFLFFLNNNLNEFPNKYVFSDWLINYEGGFIRRGLLGQIIFEISNLSKIKIHNVIFFFQGFGYLLYFYLFLKNTSKIKFNFFWILLIFSTISFIYPLSELEALGRKDIFVLSSFLIFSIINYISVKHLILSFCLIFTLSVLIHEITLFYLFYYLIVIYFNFKVNLEEKINLKFIIYLLTYLIFLICFITFIGQDANIDEIINSYKTEFFNLNIGTGAIGWLSKSFMEQLVIIFQNISLIGIIRYSYILIINIIVILYFIKLKDLNIKNFIILKI